MKLYAELYTKTYFVAHVKSGALQSFIISATFFYFSRSIIHSYFLAGTTCSYHHSVVNLEAGSGHETMIFESPNYGGGGKYLPDLQCIFNLTVPVGKRVKLEFMGPVYVTVSKSSF
jgi:hypothetical protein